MSYTIMYGKQFIKTTRGIIPLALYGDNNVTEHVNGREVRERHWGVFANNKTEFTPDEYMSFIQSWCGSTYQEHFMSHGKWVDDKGLITWAKNGIKNALTIEEIKEAVPVQSLTCYILIGINDSYKSRQDDRCFCDTTKQLETWLDNAYRHIDELKSNSRYAFIALSLFGREPLSIAPKKEPEGKVLVSNGRNKYLSKLTESVYGYTSDISKAIVFNSTHDARNCLAQVNRIRLEKLRFVKAENQSIAKDYRVLVKTESYPDGVYVQKLTRSSLYFCRNTDSALKFVSEQSALKYIDKLKPRFSRITDYAVIHCKPAEVQL